MSVLMRFHVLWATLLRHWLWQFISVNDAAVCENQVKAHAHSRGCCAQPTWKHPISQQASLKISVSWQGPLQDLTT